MSGRDTEVSTGSFDSFESDLNNLLDDDVEISDDEDSETPVGKLIKNTIQESLAEKGINDRKSNPSSPRNKTKNNDNSKRNSTIIQDNEKKKPLTPSPQKKVTISKEAYNKNDNSSTFALTSASNAKPEDDEEILAPQSPRKPIKSPEGNKRAPRRVQTQYSPKEPTSPQKTAAKQENQKTNANDSYRSFNSFDMQNPNYVDSQTQHDRRVNSSDSIQSIPSDSSDDYKKPKQKQPHYQQQYTKDELERGVQLLQQRRFPDPAMSAPLNDYIEEKMKECVMRGDYDKADTYQNLQQFLESYVDYEPQMRSREMQQTRNKTKLEQARENYRNLKMRYEALLQNAREDNAKKEQKLLEEQDKEIEDFEKHWRQPEILYPFTKPSPQLLYLRQTETHFALSKSFDRAKMIKKQADRLQKQETREARERAQRAMRLAYSNVEARHRKERDCMRTRNEQLIRTIEAERDQKLAVSAQVVQRLENAGVYVKEPVRKSYRVKPIQEDANMKSRQWSLNLGPISIRSVIRKKKKRNQRDNQDD